MKSGIGVPFCSFIGSSSALKWRENSLQKQTTRRHIPVGSTDHTYRRENVSPICGTVWTKLWIYNLRKLLLLLLL
jgi:hypothetical protein